MVGAIEQALGRLVVDQWHVLLLLLAVIVGGRWLRFVVRMRKGRR